MCEKCLLEYMAVLFLVSRYRPIKICCFSSFLFNVFLFYFYILSGTKTSSLREMRFMVNLMNTRLNLKF